jgi:hypothetical protein
MDRDSADADPPDEPDREFLDAFFAMQIALERVQSGSHFKGPQMILTRACKANRYETDPAEGRGPGVMLKGL